MSASVAQHASIFGSLATAFAHASELAVERYRSLGSEGREQDGEIKAAASYRTPERLRRVSPLLF